MGGGGGGTTCSNKNRIIRWLRRGEQICCTWAPVKLFHYTGYYHTVSRQTAASINEINTGSH